MNDHEYVSIRQAVERMRMMDTMAPHDDDDGVAATSWTRTAATTPRVSSSSSSNHRTTASSSFTRGGLGTANVVAIVTDVSVPQQLTHHDRAPTSAATTVIKRKHAGASVGIASSLGRGNRPRLRRPRHCLWIVDRSVVPEIEEEKETKKQQYGDDSSSISRQQRGRSDDDVRRHHQAVVVISASSSSFAGSWGPDTSSPMPREGDVVALYGLTLSKACRERLLLVGRTAKEEGSATNRTGHQPYEFVFDAATSYALATANPTSYPPRIQVLANVDKFTRSVQRYDDLLEEDRRRHDGAAAVDPTLSAAAHRIVSELIDWYLHSCCCGGTTIRGGGNSSNDDQPWVQQRSVSELLSMSTPSRSGGTAARRPVLSHVVARVTSIQEHHPTEDGDERSRGVARRRPPPATTTVILLSDATSELPIPLVMHSHLHGKFQQRLLDLMKTHEASSSSLWIRCTRLESVRLQDAWSDAVAPDHDHNTAMALIPTTHTTFNVIPHDELMSMEGWRSQPSQHPSLQDLMGTSQVSRIRGSTRTIEASIASICIVDADAKSTIVLNASNVHDQAAKVLPVLRRHDERRDEGDDVLVVSIALEYGDDSSTCSSMDLPRTHLPADWHVIRTLLWGGARPDTLRSGDLDDIARRLVCGMLAESIRFTWILMERHATAAPDTANDETDATYRIVDVCLHQL